MADFKQLIQTIQDAVEAFLKNVPGIQDNIAGKITSLLKQLDTKGDRISVSTENLKTLADINSQLQSLILNGQYLSDLKKYTDAYSDITDLQNEYFKSVADNFSAPSFLKSLQKQSIEAVVNKLTESLANSVSDDIGDVLRRGVMSGSSYADLQNQLNDLIKDSPLGDGLLKRYTGQIATDAINQYSGQYTQIVASGLGFEWYRYSGSNIATTRPWCLACRDRMYFHISEIPDVIKGDFPEFEKYDGKIYAKTGLPSGMIPGTDITNFMVNRGGYNCGHQWRPVSEDLVPEEIKQQVYNSAAYMAQNGKPFDIKKEYEPPETGQLSSDITGLTPLAKFISKKINEKFTAKDIKKIMSMPELNTLYTDKKTGRIILSEKENVQYDSELSTAKKLTNVDYDVIFAPDGIFGRGDKKFDVFLAKDNVLLKADLKEISSKNPDTIGKRISGGSQQASRVVVDITSDILPKNLIDGLRLGVNASNGLKEVFLFYRNSFYRLPVDLISSKNIFYIIK